MKSDRPGEHAILDAIYEAALDPEGWTHAVELLARHLGGTGAQYFWTGGEPLGIVATWSWDLAPDSIVEYGEGVVAFDPRVEHVFRRLGQPFRDGEFITEAEMARHPYYVDFAAKYGLRHAVAAGNVLEPGLAFGIGIQHRTEDGPFDDSEFEEFAHFWPHVERATYMQHRLQRGGAGASDYETLLDAIDAPLAVVDDRGRLAYLNPAACEIIDADDGLSLEGGRLAVADTGARRAWERLTGTLPRTLVATGPGSTVIVPRPSGRRPYVVDLAPLRSAWRRSGRAIVGLVSIADPEATRSLEDRLHDLFDLTAAEARFAQRFAENGSLDETAERLELTRETGRWRMKQLLGRTGTRRQAELVGLLLKSASRVLRRS